LHLNLTSKEPRRLEVNNLSNDKSFIAWSRKQRVTSPDKASINARASVPRFGTQTNIKW